MIMSQENRIHSNHFRNNSAGAIVLNACMAGGENNQFYQNCFVNNGTGNQAFDYAAEYGFQSFWYSSSESKGNFWSDYTGIDANLDGIGDTPYNIYGEYSWSEDFYPLMSFDDSDGDGIMDAADNCPDRYDVWNADRDLDGVGDRCDNCLFANNPDQDDADENGVGDACETDCGDFNGDGDINLLDILSFISYLYDDPRGIPPKSFVYSDVDDDNHLNLIDILYLIDFLYNEPPGPDPICG